MFSVMQRKKGKKEEGKKKKGRDGVGGGEII